MDQAIVHNELFEQINNLYLEGKKETALDLLYDQVDNLLLAGNFSQVDLFLLLTKPENVPLEISIGLLTITLMASRYLPARFLFFKRVEVFLKKDRDNYEDILWGLNG